jgi:DNA-binding PadR family transcriptional regulator
MSFDDISRGKNMPAKLSEHLPLTEATFFILLSLAPERKHGYAIMKDVQRLSENRVVLSTGTLYGAIKRLLEIGWIKRVKDGENGKRARQAYALTDAGRRVLDAEVTRLKTLVSTAQQRAVHGQV